MHLNRNIWWQIKKGYFKTLKWLLIHSGIKQSKVPCIIESIVFELKLLLVVFVSTFSVYTFVVSTTEPTLTSLEIILRVNGIFFFVIIFLILKILYKVRNNSCGMHHHEHHDEHK